MRNNICFIFLIVCASFVAMSIAQPEGPGIACGPNAQYTPCGIDCRPKCSDDPNPSEPTPCSAVCVAGCQCNSGYLLNDFGECVTRSEC
ncbi:chymotrypsin inhibitor-like [Bactrocera tryoni]|uniref:chymotrypsin inhibitor-like n=1 Tax=Bactrocera tryoni TaxID=59916 RepID=UPI001A979C29|nr:chymotrypsin inhibitor-like [Bactrocera tryoni]